MGDKTLNPPWCWHSVHCAAVHIRAGYPAKGSLFDCFRLRRQFTDVRPSILRIFAWRAGHLNTTPTRGLHQSCQQQPHCYCLPHRSHRSQRLSRLACIEHFAVAVRQPLPMFHDSTARQSLEMFHDTARRLLTIISHRSPARQPQRRFHRPTSRRGRS